MNSNNGTDSKDFDALDKQQLVESFFPKAPEEIPRVSDNQGDNSNKDHNKPIDNNEEEQSLGSEFEKRLPESILSVDRKSNLFKFILGYFSTFDNNRNRINTFYSNESILSIDTDGVSLPIYLKDNTNVKPGREGIVEFFMRFPQTKHIDRSIEVEMVEQSSAETICNVSGKFKGLGFPRMFSRKMTIVPAGISQIVLQDHIIFKSDSIPLFGSKLAEQEVIASNNNPQIEERMNRKKIMQLGGTKLENPKSFIDRDSDLFKFILGYFSTFDKNRPQIKEFYSEKSNLSIESQENSLSICDRSEVRQGVEDITKLFIGFPRWIKHIEQSIQVEIVEQSSEQTICNVYGVFAEFRMFIPQVSIRNLLNKNFLTWKFSRNMTIVPAGDSRIVLQEHIKVKNFNSNKFDSIIYTYRKVTKSRSDLIGLSCEIIQWATELNETTGISLKDLIDLLTEIVRVHPQWKFSSQEARMVKWVKDETGMSVTESMELLNGLLKINSDLWNASIDLIEFVKKIKDAFRMSI